jgi:Flp pilus assembly pilin Flp
MKEVLTLLLILTTIAIGLSVMSMRTTAYRWAMIVFIACLFGRVAIEYGVLIGVTAVLALVVIVPVVLAVVTRLCFQIVWTDVCNVFPNEPRRAPLEKVSFIGIYQRVWTL